MQYIAQPTSNFQFSTKKRVPVYNLSASLFVYTDNNNGEKVSLR